MPTRKGWGLLLSSVVAGMGGRALGLRELYLVAAAGASLFVAAVAYVQCRTFRLSARRRLLPDRVPVGGQCAVELEVTNRGAHTTPVLTLVDGVDGRFLLEPLLGGATVKASYRLVPGRRGLQQVGPLLVRLTDPFGLARRALVGAEPSTLVVHPRAEQISPLPAVPGRPTGSASWNRVGACVGDDFHELRPYTEGDDLRRVHWPTSARLDELVVRQDAALHQRRTAVAVDLRQSVHDPMTVERVVSAAASVAAASCEIEGLVRFVTTGGADSGFGGGALHLVRILDLLSTGGTDRSPSLSFLSVAFDEVGDDTLVVWITTTRSATGDLLALARPASSAASRMTVRFGPADGAPPTGRHSTGTRTVLVGPDVAFRHAWERAVAEWTEVPFA